MSVIEVKPTGSRGNYDENQRTWWTTRDYTKEFTVRTSSDNDTQQTVEKASGVPQVGDKYGLGTTATCNHVTVDRDPENMRVWRVVATYRSRELSGRDPQIEEQLQNKLAEPPKVRVGFTKIDMPLLEANTVTATQGGATVETHFPLLFPQITNSAGEEFGERPSTPKSMLYVEVERFEPDNDGYVAAGNYIDTVNNTSFWRCEAGQVYMDDIRGERLFFQSDESMFFYWRVLYRLLFKKEGWGKIVVDEGKNEIADKITRNSVGNIIKTIPNGTTIPVTTKGVVKTPVVNPVHLNGLGHPVDDPKKPPVLLHFDHLPRRDFDSLGLPEFNIDLNRAL